MSFPPQIEVLAPPTAEPFSRVPGGESGRPRRMVVFLGVFVPALLVGLGFVWLREPVYESRATLLTVAPIVIDQPDSPAGETTVIVREGDNAATTQHVTIQRETLLGASLLEKVAARVRTSSASNSPRRLDVLGLRAMLAVTPFPDTNVVELRAHGSEPELLPRVVDAWIDTYQEARAREVGETEDNTATALHQEVERLERKVAEKRQALDQFRRTHDILTQQDEDNQALARLRGLNESLNKAVEDEVKAKARLDAVRQAVARGESVTPPGERLSLSYLEQRAQDLRENLADLKRRYTPEYIALQPQYKLIPEQLKQVEKEIAEKTAQGQRDEIAAAEQAFLGARQSVQSLRGQIEAHKRDVSEFTTRFAQHEALRKELADMEDLYHKTQERLLHLDVVPRDKLPQLSVVNRTSPPGAPIWPDYRRDSGIAVGVSLALALFSVWLYEFLLARPHEPTPGPVHVPNINVFSVPENILLSRQTGRPASLPDHRMAALERSPPRELSEQEIRALLDAAPIKGRQLIAVLLCGLSLEEASALTEADIDLEHRQITAGRDALRTLSMPPALHDLFADYTPLPAWRQDASLDTDDLDALIACAAVDSGLPRPEDIDAEAIRHSYLAYLVRRGLRLSELERVVGPLPAKVLAWYGRLSPPGPGLRAEDIPLTHPALRTAHADGEAA